MDKTRPKNGLTLFLVGFFLMSFGAFAQDTTEGVYDDPLRFGFRIGATSSAFAIDYENVTDQKKGITVGGVISYKFLDWLRVQGEILYQQQGAANIEREPSVVAPNARTYSNIIQHNLEIPVTAQLTPTGLTGNTLEPYLAGGIAYGYNFQTYSVNKTVFESESGQEFGGSSWSNVSEFYQVNDVGALIGLGLNMITENILYTVEARYRMGLTNIKNTSSTSSLDYITTNVTTVTIQLTF